jgi:hypothetical protein
MFGGPGDDVNLWAPGDGSEAFFGGPGIDALIFGSTDREGGVGLPTHLPGVPGFPQGIPTANVSGLSNFCTVEPSPLPAYDFLVRFRGAAGIIVTIRVRDVEAGILPPGWRHRVCRSVAIVAGVCHRFTAGRPDSESPGRRDDPVRDHPDLIFASVRGRTPDTRARPHPSLDLKRPGRLCDGRAERCGNRDEEPSGKQATDVVGSHFLVGGYCFVRDS